MKTENPTPFFQSLTAKMIMVGVLSLFLLIPLAFVQNLIEERSERKKKLFMKLLNLGEKDVHLYGPV